MQDKVKGPAIALIIVGVLGGLLGLFGLVASATLVSVYKAAGIFNEDQLRQIEEMSAGQSILNIVGGLVVLAGSGLIVWGGLQMMKLRSWPICLIASILAMIPCFSSCACVLGIPIGIWAIIVLVQADVKAAFQQAPPPLQ